MSPTRLAVLGILLYILYRLIVGPRKKSVDPLTKQNSKGGKSDDAMLQDTLVRDPVCNTYIPERQSITVEHDKQMLHFCSEKCRAAFFSEKDKDQ